MGKLARLFVGTMGKRAPLRGSMGRFHIDPMWKRQAHDPTVGGRADLEPARCFYSFCAYIRR